MYVRNLSSACVLETLFMNNLYLRKIYEQQSSFVYRPFHLRFKQCLYFKMFRGLFQWKNLTKIEYDICIPGYSYVSFIELPLQKECFSLKNTEA